MVYLLPFFGPGPASEAKSLVIDDLSSTVTEVEGGCQRSLNFDPPASSNFDEPPQRGFHTYPFGTPGLRWRLIYSSMWTGRRSARSRNPRSYPCAFNPAKVTLGSCGWTRPCWEAFRNSTLTGRPLSP